MGRSVLLIDDNDRRRVDTLKDLLRQGHQVTMASTICEAEEILQFITDHSRPPETVVIAHHLAEGEGALFRASLADRFGDIQWVELRGDDQPGLDVLLIEEDDEFRSVIADRLDNGKDRITICRSFAEADALLAALPDLSPGPHAVVSRVSFAEGNGISFYLAASRRFPGIRWIVIGKPQVLPTLVHAPTHRRAVVNRII